MSSTLSLKSKIQFPVDINYLLILGDGRICISYLNNISILNKITYKLEITKEKAQKKNINSLSQLNDGKLISCANEPILNIYNIEEKTLSIHQKIDIFSKVPIKKTKFLFTAVELINKDLAICGTFPALTFYRYNSLKDEYDFNYYIYNEKDENIKHFKQINENQIILVTWKSYSMGCNSKIRLCDLEKKEIKEKSIITHKGKLYGESICKISENYLAVGICDSILIIDLKKLKKIKEYNIGSFFENICVFGNYLFCGSSTGMIYKYTINEDKLEFREDIIITNEYIHIKSLVKLNKNTMVICMGGKIIIYNL